VAFWNREDWINQRKKEQNMKIEVSLVLIAGMVLGMTTMGAASSKGSGYEQKGSSASGAEVKGSMQKEMPVEQILKTMADYIASNSPQGMLEVSDERTGQVRKLELISVHKDVHTIPQGYFACAEFKDMAAGELVDVDLDVQFKDGVPQVSQVLIHKVNGIKRYTYDEQGNRVSIEKKEVK
jgi:hypothetical protein